MFRRQLKLLKHENHYWKVGFIGLIVAAIVHLLFIPLFYFLHVPNLALFNILSVALYSYCIFGLGDKTLATHDDSAIGWLVYIELLTHGIVASYYLGLESGFHYYIYLLTILPFFTTNYSLPIHIIRMSGVIITSLLLNIFLYHHPISSTINSHIIYILGNINLFVFLSSASILVYLYIDYATKHYNKIVTSSQLDTLTGLYNREHINQTINTLCKNKTYAKKDISFMILDIDNFKSINDTYGHHVGDIVLKIFAQKLKEIFSHTVLISRWGGEEFTLLFFSVPKEKLLQKAHQLIQTIAKTPIDIEDTTLYITVSCGCTTLHGDETFATMFNRADKALYQAKKEGKNRFIYND
jgi:diguanylate cyclase (GGDEF)-like protein